MEALYEGFSILESTSLTKGCDRCSKKKRGRNEREEKALVSLYIMKRSVCQRISMRLCFKFEMKNQTKTLHGNIDGWSTLLFLRVIFRWKLVTGDPLQPNNKKKRIVPAREYNKRTKVRKMYQGQRMKKEVVDFLVLLRPAKSLQNGAGFSRKA